MSIYRGPGGAGDATTDSSTEAAAAINAAAQAATSATSAASSATSASNSATTATTQATNAANSATAAASSASAASTSASNASTSATNAASSATTATTKASEAASSATAAASSASAASTSATNAASSASSASTSATNAASSATSASNSATTATTQATNASNSATAAASSATSAASSASTATTQASNAATSATAAAASASTATTKASEASTSATNAATSATNAANSATSAGTSATNAANSASAASTSATNAASSATSAASSASAAAASYDSFDDRYLGSKSSAPTLDNDGNALLIGALYFDTTSNSMKVYNGTAWLDAYASLSGALLATNNLSDLNSVSTARTNLGLGTAALVADNTLVHLAGTETITGDKTFSSTITGSISGNAGTVTNGVYTSGSYADPTWITSIAGSKVSGNISGNAATATTATNQSGGTVAATTGSFSSSVTLSGGTANGVAYLNGSKVLTTGSALTFDGTNLGFGSTAQRITGDMNNATVGNRLSFQNSTANSSTYPQAIPSGTGTAAGFLAANSSDPANSAYGLFNATSAYIGVASGKLGTGTYLPMAFFTDGSEQMRLTSTGLGIGTSSPSTKLHVTSSNYSNPNSVFSGGGTIYGQIELSDESRLQKWLIGRDNVATGNFVVSLGTSTKATIDTSGNLGLGVTPSAWYSASRAMQLGTTGVLEGRSGVEVLQFGSNWYINSAGTYTYTTTGNATRYSTTSGSHLWYTAPSGTAGNAISFTQAMTLDASGNLGVGTSNPVRQLSIYNATSAWTSYQNSTTGTSSTDGLLVGIDLNTAYVYSYEAFPMVFGTNSAERMRIDSSGNLLVGTTSTIGGSAAGNTHIQGSTNDNASGVMWLRNSNAASGKYFHIGPVNNNGFVVYNQGNVGMYMADGATSWTANSDERMKTELTPFENAAEKVASLRAGTGRYLTDEEGVSRSFLIAQDVQKVLPEAVNVQNDEQGTLGLQYTDVIPLLVAAIQELKAELDATKAEVAALKGN